MTEHHITPDPTEEEAAAIVAALTVGLPQGAEEPEPAFDTRWRFSNRWWNRPIPVARLRPWRG